MTLISSQMPSIDKQSTLSIQKKETDKGFKTLSQVHQIDTLSSCIKKEENTSLNPQLPSFSLNSSYLFLLANFVSVIEHVKQNVSYSNEKHIDESVHKIKTLSFEHFKITNSAEEQEYNCKQWMVAHVITAVATATIPIALFYCPSALPSLFNAFLIGTIKTTIHSQKNIREANLAILKAEETKKKQDIDTEKYRQGSLVKSIGDQDIFTDNIKELSRVLQNMSS
ncbi:hypothetical protein RHABOEDO_000910 [Candidatus Rhabdochlamydia oedothoracis]|uniref:Uncharacterized protein n=1 Tax=Candidatus Rhabdochlamydia oedothoracis TaxID=2720720 RepID=A0ABX8V1G6_9BACT|nr:MULTISPECIES: hypothetical protein [Rhabdochlamydia]KAG6559859.1 hypothetical protein RHOW815_000130 [Candidatus Rhabdochlamydia sp. W815]MCL6756646.1 hypothetical protein [Candidatus Rhabdochlamydia oedothoracis]QYF48706.1 hypothetical protein RHABOEDO_000910 [Candidatus Rhabdochlamydia oedothoracis]